MSTIGFQDPTPASGATLNVNQAYMFRIAVVVDDAMAESAVVQPVVATGTATMEPAEAQAVDDGAFPGANFADWTVTPTAAGALTIDVAVTEGEMTIDGGAGAGSRSYTVVSAAAQRSGRLSLGLRMGL